MLRTAMEPAVASYGYGGIVSHVITEAFLCQSLMMDNLLIRVSDSRVLSACFYLFLDQLELKQRLPNWHCDAKTRSTKTEDLAWSKSIAYILAVKWGYH